MHKKRDIEKLEEKKKFLKTKQKTTQHFQSQNKYWKKELRKTLKINFDKLENPERNNKKKYQRETPQEHKNKRSKNDKRLNANVVIGGKNKHL